jgi:hypothetical protein
LQQHESHLFILPDSAALRCATHREVDAADLILDIEPTILSGEEAMTAGGQLLAGDFSAWLVETQAAIRGERASDVPCGTCTACCTSSQFIHIGPDEVDTLAHIPNDMLFPAPRMPRGHVLMGYDERGHCPMLVDNQCTIYEHRPRTCRTYDCRVFPASGLVPDVDKIAIANQVTRWRFTYPTDDDRTRHRAVRTAAHYLREHPEASPGGASPQSATQRAVQAIEAYAMFLDGGQPAPATVRVELTRRSRGSDSGDV